MPGPCDGSAGCLLPPTTRWSQSSRRTAASCGSGSANPAEVTARVRANFSGGGPRHCARPAGASRARIRQPPPIVFQRPSYGAGLSSEHWRFARRACAVPPTSRVVASTPLSVSPGPCVERRPAARPSEAARTPRWTARSAVGYPERIASPACRPVPQPGSRRLTVPDRGAVPTALADAAAAASELTRPAGTAN